MKVRDRRHTDIRVVKDHEGIYVVDPFDPESTLETFVIFEYELQVSSFESEESCQ